MDKVTSVSLYRSFAIQLSSESGIIRDDWIQFLISHHEVQSRPVLLQISKYACLCLPSVVAEPVQFRIPVPGLVSALSIP